MYYTVLDCIGLKLSAHRLTVDGLQVRCTVGSAYNLKSEVQEHTSRRSPQYGEREWNRRADTRGGVHDRTINYDLH